MENRKIAIVAPTDAICFEQAARLAHSLGIPLSDKGSSKADFILEYTTQGLSLLDTSHASFRPLRIDFTAGKVAYRAQHSNNEHLLRAFKIKQQAKLNITDATAGLGKDAMVLATAGHQVVMLEREPVLVALLNDALERMRMNPAFKELSSRMSLQQDDAVEYLANTDPDVVYLDPMYPTRDKSAAVKKDMQILQRLTTKTEHEESLLKTAQQAARFRVVVKRPKRAAPLDAQKPDTEILSANTRYDIYFCH